MRKGLLWALAAAALLVATAGAVFYLQPFSTGDRLKAALAEAAKALPPGYSLTYKSADYSLVDSRARLGGVVLSRAGTPGLSFSADEITIDKPAFDLGAAWSRAAASPSALTPDTALPVADAITVRGAVLHIAESTIRQAEAHVEGLRIFPWALLQPGVPSLLEAQQALMAQLAEHHPPTLAEELPLLRAEAVYVGAWSYDRLAAENLEMSAAIPATAGMPAGSIVYTVRRLSGSGYDRGDLKEALAEGISGQAEPIGTMSAERVLYHAFSLRQPLIALLEGKALSADMLDGVSIGRFEIDGMTAQPATGAPIALGSMALSDLAFAHGLPTSFGLHFGDIHIEGAKLPDPRAAAAFKQFGLDAVTVSFDLGFRWRYEDKDLAIDKLMLKVDELGTVNVAVDLSGADLAGASWRNARLVHAMLRYDDASLVGRAIRFAAAGSGTTPAAYQQQLSASIAQQAEALGGGPVATAAAKEIAAFLAAPRALVVALAPPDPLSLAALKAAGPQGALPLLGLSVTANPAP